MIDSGFDPDAMLIAPITTASDPRDDPSPIAPMRRIRDAREDARREERARDAADRTEPDTTGLPVPEGWRRVLLIGTEIFTSVAKDFDVATWMTEAAVRVDGLRGLRDGARLLTGMLKQHWEDGFPAADAEGIEDRARSIAGLAGRAADGTIMQPLRRSVLFRRPSGEDVPFFRYEQAVDTAGRADPELRARRHALGVPELEALQQEASAMREPLRRIAAEAAAALLAWRGLEAAIDLRFGAATVSTSAVANLLVAIGETCRQLSGDVTVVKANPVLDPPQATAALSASLPMPSFAGGDVASAVRSRDEALKALENIADFFQATEPHSPLAYTLRDAVRRGRLSWPALLAEIVEDDAQRNQMLLALGIRPVRQAE
jgi:type VI secretion system protein ImpA